MEHTTPNAALEELRAALERLKQENPEEYLELAEGINELLAELEKGAG